MNRVQRRVKALLFLVACGVAVVSCRGDTSPPPSGTQAYISRPVGIMGTQTSLAVVLPSGDSARAREILESSEAELRRVEALMSTWIEASEISRFNSAVAGEPIELSEDSLSVLRAARQLFEQTEGAFDVTCRPLVEHWRGAGREGELPTDDDLERRREESDWTQIELLEQGARKDRTTTCVDLSGIAKGYAIDRALEMMRSVGAAGGMVEVGGDLRVFGVSPTGEEWTVGIRSPVEERAWGELQLGGGAVCTSGDYARFVEIDGRRFSEVIDPRTGRPAARASSVTVIAQNAMTADAWATALAVLGPEGLELLGEGKGVEALVVSSDEDGGYRVEVSGEIPALLASSEFDWIVRQRKPQP